MNAASNITLKIWLSVSILILGYLFSMILSFILGQKIESRISGVSERRFPIAQKSETALLTFKEQIHLYSDAILLGDETLVDSAAEKGHTVRFFLAEIVNLLQPEDDLSKKQIFDMQRDLVNFEQIATDVYKRFSMNFEVASEDPVLTQKIRMLAQQIKTFQNRLKNISTEFSEDLRRELADVRQSSHENRHLNLAIFIGVVICAVFLMTIIISHSIVDPLKKSLMFEKVVEQFTDGIALMDVAGNIQFVNWAWAHMHGYTVRELKGKNLEYFYTPEKIESELNPFKDMVEREGSHSAEVTHKRKDGNTFPISMSISQILDEKGRIACMACSVKDITLQKLKEEELCQARRQAETASIAKNDFLANMSHEIRTPLNGVMGVLNLLLTTDLNEEQLDLVNTGKNSADGLMTVITDILDFSKIESGQLDIEILDFDLRNTLEEVVELPAMQAHEKKLEFAYIIESGIPPQLRGDPGRLRQIILNLTSNAVKFTHKGEIFLNVSMVEEREKDVILRFEIRDTGIGIAEEKQAMIFESFEQSDTSTTRTYGGTGLGLSISQRLVELMGGQIGMESASGRGSVFWFTVSLEKQAVAARMENRLPVSISSKRFLLVDDNRTNIQVLSGYMRSWGCSFDVAMSGEVALTLLNAVVKVNGLFDVAIIDMIMPEMDGAELGRRIKSDPLLKDMKLVMLTSMGMRGEAVKMKAIGFDAYLTKPIRKSHLFDCLTTLFNQENAPTGTEVSPINTEKVLAKESRRNVRILLVEDNPVNQKLVLKMIEKIGFKVDLVADGKEAVRTLERVDYHLVLMDIQMPVMDGFEATRNIRDPNSRVRNHNIPIVALTANAMTGDREKCLDAGMDDYLTKPVQVEELLSVIEKNRLEDLQS